jgi:hypothetical protein
MPATDQAVAQINRERINACLDSTLQSTTLPARYSFESDKRSRILLKVKAHGAIYKGARTMNKRTAFWTLLTAAIAAVLVGVVSAQRADRETLIRMLSEADQSQAATLPTSTAAARRDGMREVSRKDSLVGSWIETVTFDPTPTPSPSPTPQQSPSPSPSPSPVPTVSQSPSPTATPSPSPTPRIVTSLISFHEDGTLSVYDQGSVTVAIDSNAPSGVTGTVFTAGAGVWKQARRPRTFNYTSQELISDLGGNLVGLLKVRGTYILSSSGDTYEGRSFFEVFVGNPPAPFLSGWVTNAGQRILLERPPDDPQN